MTQRKTFELTVIGRERETAGETSGESGDYTPQWAAVERFKRKLNAPTNTNGCKTFHVHYAVVPIGRNTGLARPAVF